MPTVSPREPRRRSRAHRQSGPRRACGSNVSGPFYGCLVITRDTSAESLMKQLWTRRRPQPAPSPFDQIDFVIVDLETTGWAPEDATITEIGAVLVCGGRVRAQFSSLVNPGSAIPEQVATLTGISDAMVASAPPLPTVLAGFLSFAHGCVLAAHNAPFDVAFLTAACKACDLPWPEFRVLGEEEVADCKLATLAAHFNARIKPRHRALPDALATADVLTALLRRLAATGVSTLAEAGCV